MENTETIVKNQFTKGDYKKVLTRLHQIYDIDITLPINDSCIQNFYAALILSIPNCDLVRKSDEVEIKNLPVIDVLNVMMSTFKYSEKAGIYFGVLSAALGIIQSFGCLKFVSFKFVSSDELLDKYNEIVSSSKVNKNVTDLLTSVYTIKEIKMTLCDMFTQDIIDNLNKIMMFDEIISEDYLNRQFEITFSFEEYTSYVEYVLKSNFEMFKKYGEEVCNYLFLFPSIYTEHKPKITLVTNYDEL